MTITELDLTTVPGAPSGSRTLRGHLARPTGHGPWPGVVVLHEVFGADDDVMRRHVERLASLGYLTLMPDLFSDGGAVRCLVATFRALTSGRGRAYADIEAARTLLAGHPDSTGAVGVLGFCLGGGFALVSAGRGFDAASVNYGPVPKNLDAVLAGACPVIGSYGGRDRAIPVADVARLDDALARHGVPHQVTVYPRASHSFLNDAPSGPRVLAPLVRVAGMGPEPESAAQAWVAIDAFLARHLRAAPPHEA